MNAGGHIAVATAIAARSGIDAGSGHLLGSALPDLAAMGRFRLLGRAQSAGLTAGIRLHHRTDDEFHRHPWFRRRNRQLTAELTGAGLGRGPAMASSHVGIELLLDGQLLAHQPVDDARARALGEIAEHRGELVQLVKPVDRARWLGHLEAVASRGLPTDYDDPDAVAERLHRMLAARPRLAMEHQHIAPLAAALARYKPGIDATARALVDSVAELVTR